MTAVTQNIKISCQNTVIKGTGAKSSEGHPWRNWKISIVAMDGDKEVKGKLSIILDRVEYILHPSFEEPRRTKKDEPYILQEKGWGEFDMRIVLYFYNNLADPHILTFDLNFALTNYSKMHTIDFPNPTPELIKLLSQEPPSIPQRGGKKPLSSPSTIIAATASANSTAKTNSTSVTTGTRQSAKKKPTSSTPHSKTAKKAKPESRSDSVAQPKSSSSKQEKQPAKRASSLTRSPSNELSPAATNSIDSSPSHLLPTEISNSVATITADDEDDEMTSTNDVNRNGVEGTVEYIHKMSDVFDIDPIHNTLVDLKTSERWDVPQISMMELVKRMYRMSPEQSQEFQRIIADNLTANVNIMTESNQDGDVGIDLYSLGRPLLEKLWDYSADLASDDDSQSFSSQDQHPSDLENNNNSDTELGEYNSDEDKVSLEDYDHIEEPSGYREIKEFNFEHHQSSQQEVDVDEPGFLMTDDSEDERHKSHHYLANGHNGNSVSNSDMDFGDDGDF